MEPAKNTRASDTIAEMLTDGQVSVFDLMKVDDLNLNEAKRALLDFYKKQNKLHCLYMVQARADAKLTFSLVGRPELDEILATKPKLLDCYLHTLSKSEVTAELRS